MAVASEVAGELTMAPALWLPPYLAALPLIVLLLTESLPVFQMPAAV
jgi:hypothetical protein